MDKEPNKAKLMASCACQDVVKISYKPLWPRPVNGPLCASRISLILCPIPQFVLYWCPATRKSTAIAKWWCAQSVKCNPPVVGFKPPLKVKKSLYSFHWTVKNGASP